MRQPFSRHKILLQGLFPFTFIMLIWMLHLAQAFFETDWAHYVGRPRTAEGITGIFTGALFHGSWEHLIGNSVPLLVLGLLLFNAYRDISGKVFWTLYLVDGLMVWLFARNSIHIGASGIVYGMASFLFFSGMIRKHPQLAMISLLIVFLYGSMVWGIFPFDPKVSWESHLYGGLSGLVMSFIFRKQGPQPPKYWQEEEDEEETELKPLPGTEFPEEIPVPPVENPQPVHPPVNFRYIYKPSEKNPGEETGDNRPEA